MSKKNKPKRKVNHSSVIERRRARRVFLMTENYSEAAKEVGRVVSTVTKWAKTEQWEEELEEIKSSIQANLKDEVAADKAAEMKEKAREIAFSGWLHLQARINEALKKLDITALSVRSLVSLLRANTDSTALLFDALGLVSKANIDNSSHATITVENVGSEMRHAIIVDAIETSERTEELPAITGG